MKIKELISTNSDYSFKTLVIDLMILFLCTISLKLIQLRAKITKSPLKAPIASSPRLTEEEPKYVQ